MRYVTLNFHDEFLAELDGWAKARGLPRNRAIMELHRLATLLPEFDAKAAQEEYYRKLFVGGPTARLAPSMDAMFADLGPTEPES